MSILSRTLAIGLLVLASSTVQGQNPMRAQMLNHVFGQPTLPTIESTVTYGVSDPNGISGYDTVDKYVYDQNYGYLYSPEIQNGKLLVVHQGHSPTLTELGLKETVELGLSLNWNVLLLGMPGRSGNGGIVDHNAYTELAPFLNHIVAALNKYNPQNEVVMTGLSGGGWSTTIYAALDTRITTSIEFAGSIPWGRRSGSSVGDWEQAEVVKLVDYPAWYVMGADGGRVRYQVLNKFDDQVFAEDVYGPFYFSEVIQPADAAAQALGGRVFWFEDASHSEHKISEWGRTNVLVPILSEFYQTLDDGDINTFATNGWTLSWQGQGEQDDVSFIASGNGSEIYTWSFGSQSAGTYSVKVSWSSHTNRATNAKYTVKVDGSPILTWEENQREGPAGGVIQWGTSRQFTSTGGLITVELSDDADGYVIADSVKIWR